MQRQLFLRVGLFVIALFLMTLWAIRLYTYHHMYAPDSPDAVIYVKIEGEVATPGIVELSGGAVLEDAISLCGGLTDQAGPVDLQRTLANGDRITIPTQNVETGTLLDLNTATLQQLMDLPDIGEKTAQKILDYREKNGGFHSIDELMLVSGIGEKTYALLAPLITISS